jgi:GTP cyclohydrolase FolE2
MTLADVQSQRDTRGIALDDVGINELRYPVLVFDPEHGNQATVANVALSVPLPAEQRGSHLSRFVEVLDAHAGELTPGTIPGVLRSLQERLGSSAARMRVTFPYFLRRHAPVSGASALTAYRCGFTGSIRGSDARVVITATVPVTSVCPCSKAISDYGAHNQRGHLTIDAVPTPVGSGGVATIWFDELIAVAEASASSPVFPVLKRVDERHVTMRGYDHPVFVEDMVRAVAERLRLNPRIKRFRVEGVTDGSIHNHCAFARHTWPPATDAESEWW